jgi:hypothetical protein
MSFADLDALRAALTAPHQTLNFQRFVGAGSSAAPAAVPCSTWTAASNSGSAPTTAAACTSATTGALVQGDAGASTLVIAGCDLAAGWSVPAGAPLAGTVLVYDRLSHQGGLSGSTTGAQTTNLPTAALSRYTSGVGVWIALEVYTAVGPTVTTVTASYTNQAGTASHATTAVPFGNHGPGRMIFLPLAAGDTGVRSVESVTLAASTLTAGAFGVTLLRPLALVHIPGTGDHVPGDHVRGHLAGHFEEVVDGACLALAVIPRTAIGASTACVLSGALLLAEV